MNQKEHHYSQDSNTLVLATLVNKLFYATPVTVYRMPEPPLSIKLLGGESCAYIGHHTYANPGTYDIAVSISTLGNADQPVQLYSGATVAIVTK